MRFRLIDAAKKEFPVQRLCKVLGVSQSGYFARKDRPACRRQHEDMVLLAHIRSAFALSNATYGSPRITRELRDDGVTIGRHRVARLMRENALKARQRRRFKRTADSLHAFPVAPNVHPSGSFTTRTVAANTALRPSGARETIWLVSFRLLTARTIDRLFLATLRATGKPRRANFTKRNH